MDEALVIGHLLRGIISSVGFGIVLDGVKVSEVLSIIEIPLPNENYGDGERMVD